VIGACPKNLVFGKRVSVLRSAFRRSFNTQLFGNLGDCKSPPEGRTTNRNAAQLEIRLEQHALKSWHWTHFLKSDGGGLAISSPRAAFRRHLRSAVSQSGVAGRPDKASASLCPGLYTHLGTSRIEQSRKRSVFCGPSADGERVGRVPERDPFVLEARIRRASRPLTVRKKRCACGSVGPPPASPSRSEDVYKVPPLPAHSTLTWYPRARFGQHAFRHGPGYESGGRPGKLPSNTGHQSEPAGGGQTSNVV